MSDVSTFRYSMMIMMTREGEEPRIVVRAEAAPHFSLSLTASESKELRHSLKELERSLSRGPR
jgi:hypothetical protein